MHPDAGQIIALELPAGRSRTEAEKAAKRGRAFPNYFNLEPRSRSEDSCNAAARATTHPLDGTLRALLPR
jgi:hypothetical protein